MARRRHPNKDIEKVLVEAEAHGWRFDTSGKVYWRALCSCGNRDHQRSVHLTPSDPNYPKNLAHWFRRMCWKDTKQ